MRLPIIAAIAEKDLRESTATSQVLLPIVILPLVFILLYPGILLIGLRYAKPEDVASVFEKIPPGALPLIAGMTPQGQAAYLSTVFLFAGFFLLIPVMVASVLSANSFAGEKERHTLEGVLYTPVSDTELVVGKIVGAVLPAIVFSWLCFIAYAVVVNVLGAPLVGRIFFPTLNWWVMMLLVVPTVSLFVTAAVVWVSARVRGYQEANSIAGFAVVPIILLVVGQAFGVMLAGPGVFALVGVVLGVADVLLMRWIIATFDREKVIDALS